MNVILMAAGGFIFGYDTGQVSGFLEMRDFLNRFGQRRDDGTPYFSNVRSGLIVALVGLLSTREIPDTDANSYPLVR